MGTKVANILHYFVSLHPDLICFVISQYWNIAYGAGKGEVKLDTEGMQTMRTLATNMAFLLQKIHTDGHSAPQRDEMPAFMNFIR